MKLTNVVHAGDPRFGYGLLEPRCAPSSGPRRLLVAIHDSVRDHVAELHGFADFADEAGLVVVAPWFPAGVLGDGNEDGYKFLAEADIRYDLLLLDMVRDVSLATRCDAARFLLHGYSGGAQFAHRFALLHPQRVAAVCVGAPGEVTLVDETADWWAGTRDASLRFGRRIDPQALAHVDWHLVVGEDDRDTAELKQQPPSCCWRDDAERLAANRIDRLRALHRSLKAQGVDATFETMPGAAHGPGHALSRAVARRHFARHLGVKR